MIIGCYEPSEPRVGPKLKYSMFISRLAGNLRAETSSTATASATTIDLAMRTLAGPERARGQSRGRSPIFYSELVEDLLEMLVYGSGAQGQDISHVTI